MFLAIGVGLTGCGASKDNSDIADAPAAEYELVFNDEFNGTELDKSVWATSAHEVRRGGYWDTSQVRVEKGSEIDIFESAVPNKIQNAIHYAGYNKRKTNPVFVEGLYNEYHICGLDWKKDKMTFYYDGEVMWEITDPEMISTKPVSMRLSTEISGKADENGIPKPGIFWVGNGVIDESADLLPSLFEVDYLRIYDNGDLVVMK